MKYWALRWDARRGSTLGWLRRTGANVSPEPNARNLALLGCRAQRVRHRVARLAKLGFRRTNPQPGQPLFPALPAQPGMASEHLIQGGSFG